MKILIACDGSTCADDAVNDLPRAGLPRQADTLIVHVQEKWLPPPPSYEIVGEVLVSSNFAAAQPARENYKSYNFRFKITIYKMK